MGDWIRQAADVIAVWADADGQWHRPSEIIAAFAPTWKPRPDRTGRYIWEDENGYWGHIAITELDLEVTGIRTENYWWFGPIPERPEKEGA